jgi:glycine betaine/proline transport system substrate-binding protein
VTAASKAFVDENPDIAALMGKVSFTNAQMGEVLAWRLDNNASYDEAAVYYLTNNKETWAGWLNDEAKGKLSALLK